MPSRDDPSSFRRQDKVLRNGDPHDRRIEPGFETDYGSYRRGGAARSGDSRLDHDDEAVVEREPRRPDEPPKRHWLAVLLFGRRRQDAPPPPPRRRRGIIVSLFRWLLLLGFWGVVIGGGGLLLVAANLPQLSNIEVPQRPPNIQIVDVNHELIANRGDSGGEVLHLSEMPKYLPEAVIATEDKRFYSHFGIDPVGLTRAFYTDMISHGVVQGGSTLTQQLAKNLFLTPDRTLSRKVQEVVLALRLEMKFSKDQILELYLNRVYMGAGAYGVDAAARRYFGKSARSLTLLESAILAGLLKAPSRYSPAHDRQLALDRAATVLKLMQDAGYINDKERQDALKQPLYVAPNSAGGSSNYVADWVMDILPGYVSSVPGDLMVETTVDLRLQRQADAALYEALEKAGPAHQVGQGALVSMDTGGAVRALIGGKSYNDSQYNRAIQARRQPGSAFKAFVYLTAMEHGMTPQTVRVDEPVVLKGWAPKNFEKTYEGPITLTRALADSINTVAIRVASELGPKAIIQTARRLGISSDIQPNLSIALGTSEVTPLELTAAYVPFANGGTGIIPYIINKISTRDGTVLFERSGSGVGQVIDPAIDAEMNYMMTQTLAYGTARGGALTGMPAAGKTGTSSDYRDAWFIGYTAHLVTGVWVGNDDGTPTRRTTGGSVPVAIWKRYMTFATHDMPADPLPGVGPGQYIAQPLNPGDVLSSGQGRAMAAAAPPPMVPVGAPVVVRAAQPEPSQLPLLQMPDSSDEAPPRGPEPRRVQPALPPAPAGGIKDDFAVDGDAPDDAPVELPPENVGPATSRSR